MRFKLVEEQFAAAIMMGLDSKRPEAAGLYERFSRRWKPSSGRDSKDRQHRLLKFQSIMRNTVWTDPHPGETTLLVRTPIGLVVRAAPVSPLDHEVLKLVVEKLVRGLHYAETGLVLGRLRLEASIVTHQFIVQGGKDLQDFFAQPARLPVDKRLGPGLWYRRHHDLDSSMWLFRFWGQLPIVARVDHLGPTNAKGVPLPGA